VSGVPVLDVDVAVPTCGRPEALVATLAGLAGQRRLPARVVVADQTPGPGNLDVVEVRSVVAELRRRGVDVEGHRRPEQRGVAEQRAFLLARVRSPYALFLDDDVLLEPEVLGRLREAIGVLACGFVGAAVQGLSHLGDVRPHEQRVEWWDGPVRPERVRKGNPAWERWRLHNAANLVHVERGLGLADGEWRAYKVAWVGGCVLFDVAALRAVGGWDFWPQLPAASRAEDLVVQLRLLEAYGGAGVVPSGAHHLELPTTLVDRRVDAYSVVLEAADAVAGG
jgi:GT2 family glycosyltransferase